MVNHILEIDSNTSERRLFVSIENRHYKENDSIPVTVTSKEQTAEFPEPSVKV